MDLPTGARGTAAVADFGDFPGAAGDAPGVAEIVVVAGGARIDSAGGELVFGPFAPAGLGGYFGGPPTVADFDSDGSPEFGVAGGAAYVVFDVECDADPVPAGCLERGVRWSQPIPSASHRHRSFDSSSVSGPAHRHERPRRAASPQSRLRSRASASGRARSRKTVPVSSCFSSSTLAWPWISGKSARRA